MWGSPRVPQRFFFTFSVSIIIIFNFEKPYLVGFFYPNL